MYKLNLPPFQPKLRAAAGKAAIYDALRRKFVALTPEEWVRQHFVNFLTAHKGYPAAFMANEVELHVGKKRLRCDSVLYDTALRPRMIIEYKAPTVQITQSVFDQIAAYNDKNSAQIEVRLTATGYLDGAETGTASILLAGEYEDEKTDTKAYVILDEWTAFDLSGLGNVDSIDFGITVPAGAESSVESYFCLDDFVANINIFIPGE